jgi:hypothetical protein
MSTAVHPEGLAQRRPMPRVWRVTAAVLVSVAIGVAGGIAVGNAIVAHETTNVAPTTLEQVTQFSSHSRPHGGTGHVLPANDAIAKMVSIENN